ncbi:MAG: hypothetical protein R3C59_00240 [Planctomycetaceae bacterium]
MARSSYFQDIGNPIQRDRQPDSQPTLEFLCRKSTPLESAGLVLCWGVILLASSLGAWFLLQRGHSLPTPPFLVVAVTAGGVWLLLGKQSDDSSSRCTDAAGMVHIAEKALSRMQRMLTNVSIACGVLIATGFASLPAFAHQLTTAIVLGNLTRAFGKHFVGYCTASPMPRSEARALRHDADRIALCLSAWPSIVVIVGNLLGSWMELMLVSIMMTTIAAVGFGRRYPSEILTAPCKAILQWCIYNVRCTNAPGLFLSPVGSWWQRLSLTATGTILVGLTLYPLLSQHSATLLKPISIGAGFSILNNTQPPDPESAFLLMMATPAILTILLPTILTWPLLVHVSGRRINACKTNSWNQCIEDVRSSPDSIERESVFIARLIHDGSPMLVPRSTFHNHAHFLGDSGSGKTSLGLAPLCEQLIQFGDCSFVVLDLKGDSLELFAAMKKAAEAVRRTTGNEMPVKHFTNRPGRSTYAFNPMCQAGWEKLDPYTKADILCAAFGLNYGSGYGLDYYSSASTKFAYELFRIAPKAKSFRELVNAIGTLLARKGQRALHDELRAAGLHMEMVLERLATVEALNVDSGASSAEVADEQIDLSRLFQRPELIYFSLSSMLAPGVAPEIARNVVYFLLGTSALAERRKCQVFLVIDEFQRIVANNLESILQLARSMNVGVILANQSMEDLRTSTTDLIPALEANCRYRQWFAVSSSDDRARVVANSGEVIEEFQVRNVNDDGVTYAYAERVMPRLTQNDVLLISDHPLQSIVTITHGDGYAQYGGMAVGVESGYHISRDEYKRRKEMSWPAPNNGAFIPRELRESCTTEVTPTSPRGPVVTTEFFGRRDDEDAAGAVNLPPRPGRGPRKPTAGRMRKEEK